ncbi:hypothetical protein D3C87_1977990 [compost metagenome]
MLISRAAIRFRARPPMFVKVPPTYTTPPLILIVATALLEFGSHDVTTPVLASIAAILSLVWPPIEVKDPPI